MRQHSFLVVGPNLGRITSKVPGKSVCFYCKGKGTDRAFVVYQPLGRLIVGRIIEGGLTRNSEGLSIQGMEDPNPMTADGAEAKQYGAGR
jgi:hypothetical protein